MVHYTVSSFRSFASKGCPSGYSKSVCVPACTQKTPNLRCCFLKRRLTNTPRCHCLADGRLSSLYPPSPSFSSFGAASVMLCYCPRASSSIPSRPSVYYPGRFCASLRYDERKSVVVGTTKPRGDTEIPFIVTVYLILANNAMSLFIVT